MRVCAACAAGALAVMAACAAPEHPDASARHAQASPGAPRAGDGGVRLESLRRARVWAEPPQPISAADLAANPPGPGSFRTDEVLSCTFVLRHSDGWSPKFDCTLDGGEQVRVKYGHKSAEVFAEVAATRLLSALGFGADRMYVVSGVRCRGCPLFPYPKLEILDAVRRDQGREVTFDMAVIERKMPGRAIQDGLAEGWTWPELDLVDPSLGGSSAEEVDALRLAAVFLGHWDNKAANQRLQCLPGADGPQGCTQPFALVQDLGQTFGPRSVDLDGWRSRAMWSDAAACRVSMKGLPYDGATFEDTEITEAGRRFLGRRLRQLSHAQLRALFAGARFPEFARQSPAGRDVENWARAFEDRVRQIVDRPPCPR
ncbi:MAG TPA: hypothetical protein VMR21_01200 [Vicinamibacteria bacterium]|nr:hypothetical protein [Vicinamibacteria bacterium]